MHLIWLKVISGTVNVGSQRLSFQCGDGDNSVVCCIMRDALDDLIQFHRFDISRDEPFDALLTQIERIANAKFNAGRVEPNGELVIKPVDLLRYGFRDINDSAA